MTSEFTLMNIVSNNLKKSKIIPSSNNNKTAICIYIY